ncbi:MotA/TolQ/ExbB proton channel family protein [Siphonobacter aquaeclarae]|jgi:biopolymer transport protein ExbB|uniref:Outer membrane transport energization protein ExbB n=1 Tax=Siphonobacter aquaeclarae TaxID=563176 RepID=A0A1G9Q9D1_9BACT|nr:MotA/TolQ/ExbB proton channel family protein [Siphonobacter aquaeclarae]MBO9636785.1 MotA/TolQ/ExbB proton channel family protein [Siphonobacter aquaeclarae]SDM07674.1 outer membrane transport energization protein ExbB [Siphonobacter aquaeclarae]
MSNTTKTPTPAAKPAAAPKKKSGGVSSGLIILILAVVAHLFYHLYLGNGSHFEGGDNANEPIPGDYFGIVYKGGFIVPILMTCFLTALTFTLERFFTLGKANGTGKVDEFVRKVQTLLNSNDIPAALKECDKQKGSVGNVVSAALKKYQQLTTDTELDKEQKLVALSKEIEEATTLEMPMLEKNLTIIATLASVSTLVGLLGTVLGMIRSFAAMGQSGQADSSALAQGISEALINTALGIGTSAICLIAYNYFTSQIDSLTYNIDEIGLSISNNFAAHY